MDLPYTTDIWIILVDFGRKGGRYDDESEGLQREDGDGYGDVVERGNKTIGERNDRIRGTFVDAGFTYLFSLP